MGEKVHVTLNINKKVLDEFRRINKAFEEKYGRGYNMSQLCERALETYTDMIDAILEDASLQPVQPLRILFGYQQVEKEKMNEFLQEHAEGEIKELDVLKFK